MEEVKELPTQDGVYTEIISTEELPKITFEEADTKEQEIIPEGLEGGI